MKSDMKRKKMFAIGLILSLIIFFTINAVSYWSTKKHIESRVNVEKTLTILYELENLISMIKDAENGQRGFIITGSWAFLEPYYNGITAVHKSMRALKELTPVGDQAYQNIDIIQGMIEKRFVELYETIILRKERGLEVAIKSVMADQDEKVMTDIRNLVAELKHENTNLLHRLNRISEARSHRTLFTILAGNLVAFLFFFFSLYQLSRDITERKRAEKALRESEERFRIIFATIIDVYYRADLNGNLTMVSPSGVKLLGYDSINEMLGKNIAENFYDNPAERESFIKQLELNHKVLNFQSVLKRKDGTLTIVEVNSHYVYDQTGKPIAVEGVFRDITKRKLTEDALRSAYDELERRVEERTQELTKSHRLLEKEIIDRKRAEEKIIISLKEKEALLGEIHHRVKNNFEIISSLLGMSRMRALDKESQNVLMNAQTRIHSMVFIHNQLYHNELFDRIDMGKHIKELANSLLALYTNSEKKINLVTENSQVYLSVNQAIPCSLVLNELIANAFKHGFIKTEQGTIQISIDNSADDTVFIRVRDNGDGIPDGVDLNQAPGLGIKLARHLIEGQLKGTMEITSDNGAEICIEFKKKPNDAEMHKEGSEGIGVNRGNETCESRYLQ